MAFYQLVGVFAVSAFLVENSSEEEMLNKADKFPLFNFCSNTHIQMVLNCMTLQKSSSYYAELLSTLILVTQNITF